MATGLGRAQEVMSDGRLQDLIRFYSILNQLENAIGGARALADCHGRMKWPARGVYFFREGSENRSDTGEGPREVRVGTHAEKQIADLKVVLSVIHKWHLGTCHRFRKNICPMDGGRWDV